MRTSPAAWAAAVLVIGLAAGCARGPQAAPTVGHMARTAGSAGNGIFSERFGNPSLTFAGGSLYLTYQRAGSGTRRA